MAIMALASAQGAMAQNRPAAPAAAAQAPAANAPAPAVAEPADRQIKEMAAYVGSANEFTFHADITFDHVLPSGQKLQFSAADEVVLQWPSRLYVEWNGDLGARQFPQRRPSAVCWPERRPFDALFIMPTYPPDAMVLGARPSFSLGFAPAYNFSSATGRAPRSPFHST